MYECSACIPACQKKASDPTTVGCELPSWFLGIVLRTSGTPAPLPYFQSMIRRTYTVYCLYPGSNVNSKVNIKTISLCLEEAGILTTLKIFFMSTNFTDVTID